MWIWQTVMFLLLTSLLGDGSQCPLMRRIWLCYQKYKVVVNNKVAIFSLRLQRTNKAGVGKDKTRTLIFKAISFLAQHGGDEGEIQRAQQRDDASASFSCGVVLHSGLVKLRAPGCAHPVCSRTYTNTHSWLFRTEKNSLFSGYMSCSFSEKDVKPSSVCLELA